MIKISSINKYLKQLEKSVSLAQINASIKIVKVALLPKHPYLATQLNNQAFLYYSQRKYEPVEVLLKQALDIFEQIYRWGTSS